MYILLRLLAMLVPRLPRRLVLLIGTMSGTVAWLVANKARKQATRNALHVLGVEVVETRAGRRKLRRTVRGMFITNVYNYLEVCALPTRTSENIQRDIAPEGAIHLDEMLAQGKGGIVISAHFGPFDYLSQYFAVKGYSLTIPVENLDDKRMLDFMLAMRRSHGIEYVPLTGTSAMRTLIQQLRANHLVLITGDRTVQGQSVEVPFFGATARLPIGPIRLALQTGAPLGAAFGWYGPHQRIEGAIVPITLNLPEAQRTAQDAIMHLVVKTLEQYISAHPEQWSVFTPVWVE